MNEAEKELFEALKKEFGDKKFTSSQLAMILDDLNLDIVRIGE